LCVTRCACLQRLRRHLLYFKRSQRTQVDGIGISVCYCAKAVCPAKNDGPPVQSLLFEMVYSNIVTQRQRVTTTPNKALIKASQSSNYLTCYNIGFTRRQFFFTEFTEATPSASQALMAQVDTGFRRITSTIFTTHYNSPVPTKSRCAF